MVPRTHIAVPLVAADPPLAAQAAAARAAGATLLELRVDAIGDVAAVEQFLRQGSPLPCILTIRHPDEGGHWTGDEAERISLIERLGLLKPGYIDIELATWRRSANIRQKIGLVARTGAPGTDERPNQLIVSHHDFASTPVDLDAVFSDLAGTPAEIIKAVFSAGDATDALRVLRALQQWSGQRKVIALAMGAGGEVARILAGKFGAFLTFATLQDEHASAPGQPGLAALRELYRWDHIGPDTAVFGVVGWPVTHSKSPQLHNAGMTAAGRDGIYIRLPVKPTYAGFAALMDVIRRGPALDVRGLSVTIPHKEHALRWLDEHGQRVSELARRCGAVNTLTCDDDGIWDGDNTDAAGVLAALRTAGLDDARLARSAVSVLGAGGAARAGVAALQSIGSRVTVYNRTRARAEALARELRCGVGDWSARPGDNADVLINCTSVGLWPKVEESPVPAGALRRGSVVFDTVYRPETTRLLADARDAGCAVVTGVEMFVAQAAAQFTKWHGVAAPEDVLRRAFRA